LLQADMSGDRIARMIESKEFFSDCEKIRKFIVFSAFLVAFAKLKAGYLNYLSLAVGTVVLLMEAMESIYPVIESRRS